MNRDMYKPGTEVYCYYKVCYYEKIRLGKVLGYTKTPEGEFYNVLLYNVLADTTECLMPVSYVSTHIMSLIRYIQTKLEIEYVERMLEIGTSATEILKQENHKLHQLNSILQYYNEQE